MDGFDDLLSSSRRVSNDNPFDDPFAKRSSSPDPWANPFAQAQTSSAYDSPSGFGTPSGYDTPVFQDKQDIKASQETTSQPQDNSSDPLKAEALSEEEPVKGHVSVDVEDDTPTIPLDENQPFSPVGFRQIPPLALEEEEVAAPQVEKPREPAPVITSPPSTSSIAALVSPTSPAVTSPPSSPSREHTPPASTEPFIVSNPSAILPAASTTPSQPTVISPLSQSDHPTTQSFRNLSIGGESWNGWPSEQTQPFTTAPPSSGWKSNQPDVEEDDDDDRPLQAIVDKSRAEASKQSDVEDKSPINELSARKEQGETVFNITVDDPQKVGDPIRGYTMYTVHTRTTAAGYRAGSFSVLRRYSDFLWLYETLSLNNPGVVVPPVPEKSPFGRFEDAFVQQRRVGLEKCINKMANHPVLTKDADLKMFLESDTFALDIKQRKHEIANERGGLMASIGHTISGPRFYETDEWFDRQKGYLDSLESQLRGFVKSIDTVAKQRAELASATGEFAARIHEISESDVGASLSQSIAGLAAVQRKAEDIQNEQSRRDVITILSTADEYARLINSVRLAFGSRIRTYNAWQAADAEVRRVKQTHEKNKAQGRIPPERMGLAMNQVAEAERRALEAKTEFEQCGRLIKAEVVRFEQERIGDFKLSLQAFLDSMVEGQKQLIAAWENYQQHLLKKVNTDNKLTVSDT